MDEGTDDDNSYWATNSSTSIFYDISNSNNVSNSNNGTDTAPSSSSTGIPATQNDAAVLRATFVVYGSFLAVTFLIFCVVRRAYPRAYQLRNWVPHIKVRLYVYVCLHVFVCLSLSLELPVSLSS